ncbi:protein phosphatase CheZ [soil metagenome]
MSTDMEDLEALFEQTAAEAARAAAVAAAPPKPARAVRAKAVRPARAPKAPATESGADNVDVFVRVGALTRTLHDALRELGYDRHIAEAVGTLPDAQARLSYIADLTGNAAEKVLTLVDQGIAEEHSMAERARRIADQLGSCGVPSLREEAHQFARSVEQHSQTTLARYTDIMMAQDFHDLTGQTVKKVAEVAQRLEQQPVALLLDMTPQAPGAAKPGTLEGPQIDKTRSDVVHGQSEVDDLLDSMGF